jgi:hypothetical protein
MNNKTKFTIILISVFFSFVVNILFGTYLTALVSTLPVLNRLRILSPQAPIVINKREEIRISDSGDILASAQEVKSKVSSLVYLDKDGVNFAQSLINLTTDGIFLGANEGFSKISTEKFFVLTSEGKISSVIKQVTDNTLGVTYFYTNLKGVSVVNFGQSSELKSGEKIAIIRTDTSSRIHVDSALVGTEQNNFSEQIFSADSVAKSFSLNFQTKNFSNQILVNLKGECVGIFSGNSIISSDALRHGFAMYQKNKEQTIYPKFGFQFRIVLNSENNLLKLPFGLQVVSVSSKSPAFVAGLRVKDIITEIQDFKFTKSEIVPEEIFQKFNPGDKLNIKIKRGQEILNLILVVGE